MVYVLVLHDGWPVSMERTVMRDTGKEYQIFNYETNAWEDGTEQWYRHCMNTNDYEFISESSAAAIIEKNGGDFPQD